MSYRTYINNHEWLGNNEGPEIILKELKRQGCYFNDEWCTTDHSREDDWLIKFQIKDLDALVQVTEKAIKKMVAKNPEVADFNGSVEFWGDNLTYGMQELRQNAYIFRSAQLLDYVGKDNYTIGWKKRKDGKGLRQTYTLKPGAKCIFYAY